MTAPVTRSTMGSTTISLPEDLADELYARKERGESYADVIRRLLAAAEAGETPPHGDAVPSDPAADPQVTADERDTTTPPSDDDGEDLETLVEAVGHEALPGSGEKLASRLEAFRAVVEYLREHGEATPAAFRDAVYPDHPGGYTEGEDPARSWWKNAMYPALRALAERTDAVEKADTTGEWSFRGETDV